MDPDWLEKRLEIICQALKNTKMFTSFEVGGLVWSGSSTDGIAFNGIVTLGG